MKLYHTKRGILIASDTTYHLVNESWDTFINDDQLAEKLAKLIQEIPSYDDAEEVIKSESLVPLQSQEVWASGVTYYNSKLARQEESKDAKGGDYYENVYHADRPELFFKATVHRTVPTMGKVNIRKDSIWDVPEPELTLVITSNGKIVGYTIGNDMSSRSIEGENPLYLPQAKTYDACAGIGPCIYVSENPLDSETEISMKIFRKEKVVYDNAIAINQMKRTPQELVDYLYRECTFPNGSLLMTGTGIVPPNTFTLQSEDRIEISIDQIGTLVNYVR